jgi:Schlafen, AlbA_2
MSTPFITDGEILRRLTAGEDSFVERKSFGDWRKDAVRTCVAFANSCPFDGPPGLFCIGVKDDGTVESSGQNLDTLQKTFERELEEAYPPIAHHTRIVPAPAGKFVAVVIPGSSRGPHFSGPAYVRLGSTTIAANQEQFERVVDRRERKVREILRWQGKTVKLVRLWPVPTNLVGRIAGHSQVIVLDCDSFVVKLRSSSSDQPISLSLERVVLGHDPQADCLIIEAPQD